MDEGVSEGLPSMQSTSNTGGHAEDDERYHELLQLAVRQVISSKEYIDIKLITGCLSHTCLIIHLDIMLQWQQRATHCKIKNCKSLEPQTHNTFYVQANVASNLESINVKHQTVTHITIITNLSPLNVLNLFF